MARFIIAKCYTCVKKVLACPKENRHYQEELSKEKKTVKQLAREEKLLKLRVEDRINKAKKALGYAQFAKPLRQFARFPKPQQ